MTTGCDLDSGVCRKTLPFIIQKKDTNGHHLTALKGFPFSSEQKEKAKFEALLCHGKLKQAI